MVNHISEDYLSSAIARISKYLKLSESVAGATLLAVANGCTDIVTVILASLAGTQDNDLAIGSLFGANLFTGSVVLGLTILASKGSIVTHLNQGNVMFDLLFFIIGIIVFIVIGSLNIPMLYTGIALLVVYISYLFLLVRRDKMLKKKTEDQRLKELELDNELAHIPDGDQKPNNTSFAHSEESVEFTELLGIT